VWAGGAHAPTAVFRPERLHCFANPVTIAWLGFQEIILVPLAFLEMDFMTHVGQFSTDVTIPSDPAEARSVQEEIERQLKTTAFSEKEIFSIKLALEEALVNAIKHGNHFDRSKKVRISYNVKPERFDILISDEGAGFDPSDVPDPTAVENLERPCGRGLMLMRYYMNEVSFSANGNTVAMTKYRNGQR
jgi:serine/threonine-protein kinase RsbW